MKTILTLLLIASASALPAQVVLKQRTRSNFTLTNHYPYPVWVSIERSTNGTHWTAIYPSPLWVRLDPGRDRDAGVPTYGSQCFYRARIAKEEPKP